MSPASSSQPLDALPVTAVKGVGDRLASILEKLDIVSVQDLLFHLPIRYLDRTRIVPIGHLQLNTSVVIQGRVVSTQVMFGRRRSLACVIEDDTGAITLRFFHFSAAQKERLSPGTLLRCYGDPRLGSTGLEFYHPEYDLIEDGAPGPVDTTLTPVYGLTEGITQQRLRKLTETALEFLRDHPPADYLPPEANRRFGVGDLASAIRYVHYPPADAPVAQLVEGIHPYQQRLAFEELLAHYLTRQRVRAGLLKEKAPPASLTEDRRQHFIAQLPFKLTNAQQRAITDIRRDLAKTSPMLRMVQGDVGCGKTLVAALAALAVADSGRQVAVVAPTEILAEQHFASFRRWFEPLGISIAWLVGKLTAANRREALARIASGEAGIVIGTHALFQEDVAFAGLGLAIIDEQHRFGVHQRLTLKQKGTGGETPHQLIMTATPIPRTLAMTSYSELDYSVIDELPPGRTPVNTVLISQKRRGEIIERIHSACAEGRQVYWVCTLVEDSETLAAANAEETAALLQETLAGVNIGLIHGRLKAADKEAVMAAFKTGETQLLVATTVIEVGVDVPNASLMVIENPERLGLAQLHQLRGRVGRGNVVSHCVLLYGEKLSQQARERLRVLKETNDGFVIAEKDLALRGPGEFLGTRQAGDMQFRLADIQRDGHLLPVIHEIGANMLMSHPDLVSKLINRWFGKNQNYAQV